MLKNVEQTSEDKENKLFLFISTGLQEYFQGNKAKFLKIFDEISNKTKAEAQLTLWIRALTRVVLQQQRNKNAVNLLCSALVKKTAWFHSPTHAKLAGLFENFLMTALSLAPQNVELVYQEMLAQVDLQETQLTELETREFSINSQKFTSQETLLRYIREEILESAKYASSSEELARLTLEDEVFMHELFRNHRHYAEKFANFAFLAVGNHCFQEKTSKCFWICSEKREIFKPVDISYLKTVEYFFENLRERNFADAFSHENTQRACQISSLIDKLLRIFPLSREKLVEMLAEHFPHKRKPLISLKLYQFFLLALALRNFKLLPCVLSLIFDKLISIDVEIKLEDGQKSSFSCSDATSSQTSNEHARKLDSLMYLMFEFLDFLFDFPTNSANVFPSKPENVDFEEICASFLQVFQEKVLLVYQSKYVQFLMFYLCSFIEKIPHFLEEFLSLLITNITDENGKIEEILRKNSISYLSSLLARAKFAEIAVVNKSLEFLVDFLEKYTLENPNTRENLHIKALKTGFLGKNAGKYGKTSDFAAVLQGILYVLCFHGEILNKNAEMCEKLEKILEKARKFELLATISLDIIEEFRMICDKRGKKALLKALIFGESQEKTAKIELFYPFDPFLLKKSEVFVHEIYRFWRNDDESSEKCGEKIEKIGKSPGIIEKSGNDSESAIKRSENPEKSLENGRVSNEEKQEIEKDEKETDSSSPFITEETATLKRKPGKSAANEPKLSKKLRK